VPQDPFSTVAIAAYEPLEDIASKNTQPFHSSKELSVWLEKEKHQRRHDIIPPQVKIAGNYTSSMMAKWKARKNGYDEIILN
jgi:branched-subunit amino acid aminotransferase/4-amino-4-deoxychorismate lyase